MTNIINYSVATLVSAAVGFALGASVDWLATTQAAYTDGQNSILQRHVTVATDLCGQVVIPLEVLADMVTAGIMDWQDACMEKNK